MHEIVEAGPSIVALDEQGEVALTHDGSEPAVMRKRIMALTRALIEAVGEECNLPVKHTIEGGMYMRELFIPKGTLLVGKIHKQDCMNIVASGDITVLTEFGCKRVQGGFTGFSRAGLQKVGYAHEDTVFINVFRTDLTDLAEIEAAIAGTEYTDSPKGERIELEVAACLSHG